MRKMALLPNKLLIRSLASFALAPFLSVATVATVAAEGTGRLPLPAALRGPVALIETEGGDHCSGILLSSRLVLTARHCVEWVDGFTVTLRRGEPREKLSAVRILTPDAPAKVENMYGEKDRLVKGYTEKLQALIARDLALIVLDEPAASDLPMKEALAGAFKPARLAHSRIEMVGFPIHSEARDASGALLPTVNGVGCRVLSQAAAVITTDCPMTGGGSGGPVFAVWENQRFLVGIISTGGAARSRFVSLQSEAVVAWLKAAIAIYP